jgi:hypothetical protein
LTSADLHFSTGLTANTQGYEVDFGRARYVMSVDSSIPGLEGSWRMEPDSERSTGQAGEGYRSTGRDLTGWIGGEGSLTRRVDSSPAGPSRIAVAPATVASALAGKDIRRTVEIRDVRDKKDSVGKRAPMPTAVWADLMDTNKGRDKVLVSLLPALRVAPSRGMIATRSTWTHR